jgi:hypothetical protein
VSEDFKIAFKRHMDREDFPSPFISTFVSPLPAIQRAILGKNRNAAGVAIIDITGLFENGKRHNGDENVSVFSAGELRSKYGFKLQNDYNANSEWHVYGEIPSKFILCAFSADRLWDLTKADPETDSLLHLDKIAATPYCTRDLKKWLSKHSAPYNQHTGRTVGGLLYTLGVPDTILEEFSRKIAEVWHFHGHTTIGNHDFLDENGDYQEYITGVRSGYNTKKRVNINFSPTKPGAKGIATNTEDSLSAMATRAVPSTQHMDPSTQTSLAPTQPLGALPATQTAPALSLTQFLFHHNRDHNVGQDIEIVDLTNPFDVDMDAISDKSQPLHDKIEGFLHGLQAAAREWESFDVMGEVVGMDVDDEMGGDSSGGVGEGSPLRGYGRERGGVNGVSRSGRRVLSRGPRSGPGSRRWRVREI